MSGACASRARDYVEAHPDLSEPIRTAVLDHTVIAGMTPEQVEAAWGAPNRRDIVYRDDGTQRVNWFHYIEYYGGSGVGVGIGVHSFSGRSAFRIGIESRRYRTVEYLVRFEGNAVTAVEEVR